MQPTVTLESVSKTFRHRPAMFNLIGRERVGETRALQSVSLSASAGQVLVLLGPNGSGKTTLLKLVSTMLLPDAGRVLVSGCDTREDSASARRKVGCAVAHERSFFARLTARENLDFFGALEEVPRLERSLRVEEVLAAVGLQDAADRQVIKFSSGMYQKLGIARALLKRPAVLMLDEPSRSLDPSATERLWELVRELVVRDTAVMVATHDFEEAAALADHIALLHDGVLVNDKRVSGSTAGEIRDYYFQHIDDRSAIAAARHA